MEICEKFQVNIEKKCLGKIQLRYFYGNYQLANEDASEYQIDKDVNNFEAWTSPNVRISFKRLEELLGTTFTDEQLVTWRDSNYSLLIENVDGVYTGKITAKVLNTDNETIVKINSNQSTDWFQWILEGQLDHKNRYDFYLFQIFESPVSEISLARLTQVKSKNIMTKIISQCYAKYPSTKEQLETNNDLANDLYFTN